MLTPEDQREKKSKIEYMLVKSGFGLAKKFVLCMSYLFTTVTCFSLSGSDLDVYCFLLFNSARGIELVLRL